MNSVYIMVSNHLKTVAQGNVEYRSGFEIMFVFAFYTLAEMWKCELNTQTFCINQ